MAGEYQTAVLGTSGLVSHWPFADAPASGVVDDVHTNNKNGTTSGTVTQGMASILPGDTGGASILMAGGWALTADDALWDVNSHTVLGWVMPNTLRTNQYVFSRFSQWSYTLQRYQVAADLGGLTPSVHATPGEMIVPNNVFFVAAGYSSGSMVRIWINGTLLVDQATTGTLTTGTNGILLGSVAGTQTFLGRAQHFSLFNRLLTDAEVKNFALLGFRGPTEPTGGVKVAPWSRQLVASNGSRSSLRITNDSDTKVYLTLGGTAVVGAGKVLQPFGDFWETTSYTGQVSGLHALHLGMKTIAVDET